MVYVHNTLSNQGEHFSQNILKSQHPWQSYGPDKNFTCKKQKANNSVYN